MDLEAERPSKSSSELVQAREDDGLPLGRQKLDRFQKYKGGLLSDSGI